MADKYLDHGAYSGASFTASISGTTMTVTAVASGVICPGAMLAGTGVVANNYISALGTGTGGTGTYTLGATNTLASRGFTSTAGNPAATPQWGVAQEGDGQAAAPGTSATVDIDLAGVTAAAGNTLSIMGALLTCVASGAGVNQFNAGSGATLVANLVTAINRTTNTSLVVAQAAGWTTPKVQDVVFARIGTPTTTLQLMTRAGSATYNASVVTHSGMTGAAGPWTFSGGVSGCWGYWQTPNAAVLASAIARGTYGIMATVMPIAGAPLAGDRVWVRRGRSVRYALAAVLQTPPAIGTANDPLVIQTDDEGVAWPGDPVDDAFEHYNHVAVFSAEMFTVGPLMRLIGKRRADGTFSLRFIIAAFTTNSASFCIFPGGHVEGFLLQTTDAGASTLIHSRGSSTNGRRCTASKFKLQCSRITGYFLAGSGPSSSGPNHAIEFFDAEVSNLGATAVHPGVVATFQGSVSACTGVRFTDFVVGSELMWPTFSATGPYMATFSGCQFGNVTKRGPYLPGQVAQSPRYDLSNGYITTVNSDASREFGIDTYLGFAAWNANRGQPVRSAVLDDGTTGWSIMAVPANTPLFLAHNNPFWLPKIGKINSLATAARVFTLEFVAEASLTPTNYSVGMRIEYEDDTGARVFLDTFQSPNAVISVSTEAWSNEVGGFVTFQSNGTVNHNKWKLTMPSESGRPVKTGTEVSIWPCIRSAVPNSTTSYFFDPNVGIA